MTGKQLRLPNKVHLLKRNNLRTLSATHNQKMHYSNRSIPQDILPGDRNYREDTVLGKEDNNGSSSRTESFADELS